LRPLVKPCREQGIIGTMRIRLFVMVAVLALSASGLLSQAPPPVDMASIGPQVGSVVPELAGIDQFGKRHTLASIYGPKGAMLVFFRSADW
jgi:hypothetical protein